MDKGHWLKPMDRATRRKTAWQLDDDFDYQPEELDRAVQTPDQIRPWFADPARPLAPT